MCIRNSEEVTLDHRVCVCVAVHKAGFVSFHLMFVHLSMSHVNNNLIVMNGKKLQIIIVITPPNAKQMQFS